MRNIFLAFLAVFFLTLAGCNRSENTSNANENNNNLDTTKIMQDANQMLQQDSVKNTIPDTTHQK